jgi:hypothetical protein
MKNTIITIILLLHINLAHAANDFPSSFAIQNTDCDGGCANIIANNKKFASLIHENGKTGTWNYFDNNKKQLMTLRITAVIPGYYAWKVQFAITDDKKQVIAKPIILLGSWSERFYQFTISGANDNDPVLLTGSLNTASDSSTVYKGNTWNVIANIQPSKNKSLVKYQNYDVNVVDMPALNSGLDPQIFAIVTAIYNMHGLYIQVDPEDDE